MVVDLSNGRRLKISRGGGLQPAWRRDGRELFYTNPQGDIMAVPVSAGSSFGEPVRLMRPCQTTTPPSVFTVVQTNGTFAPSGDGQRVLAVCDAANGAMKVTVAIGWQARLRSGQ